MIKPENSSKQNGLMLNKKTEKKHRKKEGKS